MGIGAGVLLIIIGLILMFALKVNLPFISDNVLGLILVAGGILIIVLVLVLNGQRARRTRLPGNQYDDPTPPVL